MLSSFFFQAEDGIRDYKVTGVQTCALPISIPLGDVHPGQNYSFSGERGVSIGGLALFRANNPDGWELWKTDGTPAGTQVVKRIDRKSGVEGKRGDGGGGREREHHAEMEQ